MSGTLKKLVYNKWIATDTWVEIIKRRYDFGTHFPLSTKGILRTIASKVSNADRLDEKNPHGIYRCRYTYSKSLGKRVTYVRLQDPKRKPPKAPQTIDSWERLLKKESDIMKLYTTTQNTRMMGSDEQNKRQRIRSRDGIDLHLLIMKQNNRRQPDHGESQPAAPERKSDPWESKRAHNLFNLRPGESTRACLEHRINKLEDFLNDPSGCIETVVEALRSAYQFALDKLYGCDGASWTWANCCEASITEVRQVGVQQIRHWRTVMRWNQAFRVSYVFNHFPPMTLV